MKKIILIMMAVLLVVAVNASAHTHHSCCDCICVKKCIERPSNKGTVIGFRDKAGYGSIEMANGEKLFVHFTGIQGEGYRTLSSGDIVLFNIGVRSDGKERAINVIKLSDLEHHCP